MQIRLISAAALAVVSVTACGGGSPGASGAPASAAQTANIVIKNFAFVPGSLHVRTGTTVTWTNADPSVHTTTADKVGAETWNSGNLSQNHSYSVMFTAPGTYSFHCSIHNYMTGTITVTG